MIKMSLLTRRVSLVGAILTLLIGCIQPLPYILRGRPKGGFLGSPIHDWRGPLPPEQWFTQRLDHFTESDTRTWQQRYFINDTFFKPGGPVFIMIGGEGAANPIWMVMGQWIDYGQYYNAFCVTLEHRYYGKSHPTDDLSTSNLSYLSSEQALADLANFRNFIADKMQFSGNKFIVFGGSYPGSLAAWFRLKYPHLTDGAVATSAPIFAKVNFEEYLGVVRDSLSTTGTECNAAIAQATQTLQNYIQRKEHLADIKEQFKLCDDIDTNNSNDISNLFTNLAGNVEGIVQYNKDNRQFEGAVDSNITIDTVCEIMTNPVISDPVSRYAKLNSLLLTTYSTKCLDFKYSNMINSLRQTDWSSESAEGGRQWMYQTCTEFGYYQSSDLKDQPFGNLFPLDFSIQQCRDIYDRNFDNDFIQSAARWTNTNYGGLGIKGSKIVFPNGSIDPWHALGVTTDLSAEMPAIYIKGTAHCANMYPGRPSDPPQLVEARLRIKKIIGQWLNE